VKDPEERRTGEILRELEPEDLLKFGLIPGIRRPSAGARDAGRPRRGALVEILTEPKNALVKQYQRLFEMEDVQLTFHEDALSGDRPEGHRAQDRRPWPALDHGRILLDTMYELPVVHVELDRVRVCS
jgi:ATP-dependent Clp protease ATP-binding subunit ClpX